MELDKFIFYKENALPLDLCNEIINEYSEADELEPSKIVDDEKNNPSGFVYKNQRDCLLLNMSKDTIVNKSLHRKDLDTKLFNHVGNGLRDYHNFLPTCFSHFIENTHTQDTGYEFLKYRGMGKFIEHTDYYSQSNRVISLSINLNNNFSGGEFVFFAGEKYRKVIKQKAGSMTFFPSNFMFPHQIMPVYDGIRYAIVSWFV